MASIRIDLKDNLGQAVGFNETETCWIDQTHGGNRLQVAQRFGFSPAELIDFSANLNPFGPSRNAIQAICDSLGEAFSYPDCNADELKQILAGYLGVNKENLLLGNGAVDLIYLITNYFNPKQILTLAPTFSEYEHAARTQGAKVYYSLLEREKDFAFSQTDFLSKLRYVDTVFVCNPNNPTGNVISKQQLLTVVSEAEKENVTVVIDEAFGDFIDAEDNFSLLGETRKKSNLIVLGSLTKFFSLAGLRIGFLTATKANVRKLELRQPPWSINSLAQVAAVSSLKDERFIRESKEQLGIHKKWLFEALSSIDSLKPYPSSTNFLLVEIENSEWNSKKLASWLAQRKILIRDCSNFLGLGDKFIRLAVKKAEENKRLVDMLKEVMNEPKQL